MYLTRNCRRIPFSLHSLFLRAKPAHMGLALNGQHSEFSCSNHHVGCPSKSNDWSQYSTTPDRARIGPRLPIVVHTNTAWWQKYADDQNVTHLLDACVQNLGNGGHYGWSTQTWKGSCASVLGLHVEWRQGQRVASYVGTIVIEAGRCLSPIESRQDLYILHPIWSWKYHAQYVHQGQGMEWIQGERGNDYATSNDDVSSLFSDVGSMCQTIEAKCKRRRFDSEIEVQGHLDRGSQVGLPHMG